MPTWAAAPSLTPPKTKDELQAMSKQEKQDLVRSQAKRLTIREVNERLDALVTDSKGEQRADAMRALLNHTTPRVGLGHRTLLSCAAIQAGWLQMKLRQHPCDGARGQGCAASCSSLSMSDLNGTDGKLLAERCTG